MRACLPALLTIAALAGMPGAASAAVTVRFTDPAAYADGNLGWSPVDQRLTLDGLRRILKQLAAKRLAPGYDLEVEVLDLDLAGRIDPLRSTSGELRIMRADTWPSMRLGYTLRRGGHVVLRREETIRAQNYLLDPVAVRGSEPLRFEKAMLDNWFRTRLAAYALG